MAGTTSVFAKTDRNSEIIQRVLEGKGEVSLQSIATEYGLTRARIQRIVGDAGISMRDMKRRTRKPARLQCGICPATYLKGKYAEHCKAAKHRHLTPPGEKVERNAKVIRLYVNGGYNTSEIAEYFGVPQPVVSRILHRAGLSAAGRRMRKGGLDPADND